MSKEQRIAQLEQRVNELEQRIAEKEAAATTTAEKLNAISVLVSNMSAEYTTVTDEKPNLLKPKTT